MERKRLTEWLETTNWYFDRVCSIVTVINSHCVVVVLQ